MRNKYYPEYAENDPKICDSRGELRFRKKNKMRS